MLALTLALALQSELTDGEVRKLAGGMLFTEGPAAASDGTVYFTDIPLGHILKWDGKQRTVWRKKSGRANGLMFDGDGTLVVCEGGNRRLTRLTTDQKVTVLADSYDGKKLNSPNDLALDSRGGIYFTDPRYGRRDNLEQDREAVYYLPPGGGKVVRVADDLKRPNGIFVTRERVFIADHRAGIVYSYAADKDGTLKDKKLFCKVRCDGMTADERGNVYTTTSKGVQVFSPEGLALATLKVPERPSNCTFGGKTLYITARSSLYAIPMKVSGYRLE